MGKWGGRAQSFVQIIRVTSQVPLRSAGPFPSFRGYLLALETAQAARRWPDRRAVGAPGRDPDTLVAVQVITVRARRVFASARGRGRGPGPGRVRVCVGVRVRVRVRVGVRARVRGRRRARARASGCVCVCVCVCVRVCV